MQSCMKLITIYVTIIKRLHTLSISKRGSMSMSKDYNILEISVKSSWLSPSLWASFHSLTPLLVVSVKEGNFIKSQYELLKLSILCTRFERNYSRCTGRSSENLCSSSGAAQVNERRDETQKSIKIDGFLSFIPPWMLMYFLAGIFLISPCVWPNSGYWCCLFLTLQISLLGDNFKNCSKFTKTNTSFMPLFLVGHSCLSYIT